MLLLPKGVSVVIRKNLCYPNQQSRDPGTCFKVLLSFSLSRSLFLSFFLSFFHEEKGGGDLQGRS